MAVKASELPVLTCPCESLLWEGSFTGGSDPFCCMVVLPGIVASQNCRMLANMGTLIASSPYPSVSECQSSSETYSTLTMLFACTFGGFLHAQDARMSESPKIPL